jgi:hypothetical protein
MFVVSPRRHAFDERPSTDLRLFSSFSDKVRRIASFPCRPQVPFCSGGTQKHPHPGTIPTIFQKEKEGQKTAELNG